ncbi:FAD-binding oxidoreductase [Erwinia sp. AnSW2-5]|uniref:FAD-binding oxidoreductase n=1 Tax=Erwinia sp. AnSW2-5 TaxID=3367692 RepID=UPI00385D0B1F
MTEFIEQTRMALRTVLPEHCILTDRHETAPFTVDTSSTVQKIILVLRPENKDQVQQLVILANSINLPLYPVSTGNNWGYGTSQPPKPDCALVLLDQLKGIDLDEELSLLTVEPGVTQADLYDYFRSRNLDYMVPTTGAGPNCSIVGNALERGYGITPVADHFAAVTGLEAVMPDGEIYRSPLIACNVSPLLKWGVGPYLDGMFSQGNIGIVTSVTLVVENRPESIQMLIARVKYERLPQAITSIRVLLAKARGNIGGINVMNSERVAIMSETGSQDSTSKKRRHRESDWLIIGTIYGTKHHARATRNLIKKELSAFSEKTFFISPQKADLIRKISSIIPGKFRKIKKNMCSLSHVLGLFTGIPSDISLQLAYYNHRHQEKCGNVNPARDNCGLLWYSPLVPMKALDFEIYIDFIYSICKKHNIEPAITLTSLSKNAFDSTLPLIFTPGTSEESSAYDCYRELLHTGKQLGFVPYRLHSAFMDAHFSRDTVHARFARKIKNTIDPNNIMSPGRYE